MGGPERERIRVVKFGGSSVTGADRVDTIADTTREAQATHRPILVVSAFANVTARLERAAIAAAHEGVVPEDVTALADDHRALAQAIAASESLAVDRLLSACTALLSEIAEAGACSPECLDEVLSFGERLSTEIVTNGLVRRGVDAVRLDAADLIVTDANHGNAEADLAATARRAVPVLESVRGAVPVVTGFLGATPSGVRTTLGREGSDYSAAILGVCLDAREVQIWTDVDGVMTADPRIVEAAYPLRTMTYDELFALTSWGARIVHPRTVRPLRDAGIPLSIRNTTSPADPGTRIGAIGTPGASGALGVTRIGVEALRTPGHGTPSGPGARRQLEGMLEQLAPFGPGASVVTIVYRGQARPDAVAEVVGALEEKGIRVGGVHEGVNGTISVGVGSADADAALRVVHATVFASRIAGLSVA